MVSAVQSSSILNSTCCTPIRWVCDKTRSVAERFFGYIIRIVTFQLGEMKVRGAYWIMRIYQRLSSDPREERPFDPKRLAESKNLLIQFGGVESVVHPADGGAQVHCMTFKSADFFNAFQRLGSTSIDITHEGRPRKALLNPPRQAEKFYLPIINLRMPDGTIQKGALLPESPPTDHPPMILQSHSPGRSMAMDRKFLGLHLGAGYDVTIWDQRGTVDSTGRASEGGYYLDAEAVFQHVIDQGYAPNRIYASGFCEGAAISSHLKKKFHHLGVHFIAGNPYTSMKDVVEGYGCLGRLAASYGIKALQDPSLAVQQDCFNNVEKFRNLSRSEGKFVFLHTDTDTLMPRGTVQKICDAIGSAGPIHEILRIHPDPKANGHMQPPYEDPIIWRRYVQVVT